MIIAVASGKGGTGKTFVATNLAAVLGEVQFLDCDVEEPNAYLFLKPYIRERRPIRVLQPEHIEEKCDYCGKCAQICNFHALFVTKDVFLLFSELCHGCGACIELCPKKALRRSWREIGIIERGEAGGVDFIGGRLMVGEARSIPIIKAMKDLIDSQKTVIIDVAPGTSCPVVEAMRGSDFALLVTEPTPFGLFDLSITVELVRDLNIPCGIILNRSGIGREELVRNFAERENIPLLWEIPFDRHIAALYSQGELLIRTSPSWAEGFLELFEKIKEVAAGGRKRA